MLKLAITCCFSFFLFFVLYIYISEKNEKTENPNSSDIHCFTICEPLKTWRLGVRPLRMEKRKTINTMLSSVVQY